MDTNGLIVSLAGAILTIALIYYGLKTLRLFKTNIAARAWTYISIGSVFFAIGVILFIADALTSMGLITVGGILQTIGGVFLVLGLRKNYLYWAGKGHFE